MSMSLRGGSSYSTTMLHQYSVVGEHIDYSLKATNLLAYFLSKLAHAGHPKDDAVKATKSLKLNAEEDGYESITNASRAVTDSVTEYFSQEREFCESIENGIVTPLMNFVIESVKHVGTVEKKLKKVQDNYTTAKASVKKDERECVEKLAKLRERVQTAKSMDASNKQYPEAQKALQRTKEKAARMFANYEKDLGVLHTHQRELWEEVPVYLNEMDKLDRNRLAVVKSYLKRLHTELLKRLDQVKATADAVAAALPAIEEGRLYETHLKAWETKYGTPPGALVLWPYSLTCRSEDIGAEKFDTVEVPFMEYPAFGDGHSAPMGSTHVGGTITSLPPPSSSSSGSSSFPAVSPRSLPPAAPPLSVSVGLTSPMSSAPGGATGASPPPPATVPMTPPPTTIPPHLPPLPGKPHTREESVPPLNPVSPRFGGGPPPMRLPFPIPGPTVPSSLPPFAPPTLPSTSTAAPPSTTTSSSASLPSSLPPALPPSSLPSSLPPMLPPGAGAGGGGGGGGGMAPPPRVLPGPRPPTLPTSLTSSYTNNTSQPPLSPLPLTSSFTSSSTTALPPLTPTAPPTAPPTGGVSLPRPPPRGPVVPSSPMAIPPGGPFPPPRDSSSPVVETLTRADLLRNISGFQRGVLRPTITEDKSRPNLSPGDGTERPSGPLPPALPPRGGAPVTGRPPPTPPPRRN